jgi:DNA-binding NarL/FixJ family response regulator
MMTLAKRTIDPSQDRNVNPPVARTARKSNLFLTDREQKILRLIGLGATNNEVATELSATHHSVNSDISKILRKIGAPNRLQAALWAGVYL